MRLIPIIVTIVTCIFIFLAILNGFVSIAMFSWSAHGSEFTCDAPGGSFTGDDAECRDRTAGMGITAGVISIIFGIIMIVTYTAAIFVPLLSANMIVRLSLSVVFIVLSLILALFFLVSWALMANDINDFVDDNSRGNVDCSSPDGWSAALAFGLFGMILWIFIAILNGVWAGILFCFSSE